MVTVAGEIRLFRRYFWADGVGGHCPGDAWAGITSLISAGVREFCCTMGVIQDFAQGAEDLERLSGLRISKERLRQVVEREAEVVTWGRMDGTIVPSWSADDATVEGREQTRVYVGGDGVKLATVTQHEKDKRRQQQAARRRQRGQAGIGNDRPLPVARPGSDDRYKEMKVGLLYDQSKEHIHAFVTGQNHEGFGEFLRRHADWIGLELAEESIGLMDGAVWIPRQMIKHLPKLTSILLDFYHLSEHIWDTAKCCLGESEAAKKWAETQLHEAKHHGPQPLLAAIDALHKKIRGQAKRRRLARLRSYILERWEMLDYREALAHGWDIGSGPTEAACKNLTLRLKRTGMKWDIDHAEGMMNLIALRESRQWRDYWATQRAA